MVAINGFLVSPSPAAIGLKTYTVPGTAVRLSVRSDIAPLLIGCAVAYNQRVERLHDGWNWGYAYRLVRGGSTPSFHSAGIAIDLNAPAHPIGTSPTANYSGAQITQCRAIARQFGLRWGGDYNGRKDGMHFEVIISHTAAVALARQIQSGGGSVSPAAPVPARSTDMSAAELNILRADIRAVKAGLDLAIRGDLGPSESHPKNLEGIYDRILDIKAALDMVIRGDVDTAAVDTHPANLHGIYAKVLELEADVTAIKIKIGA
jgi:hypothetical protein